MPEASAQPSGPVTREKLIEAAGAIFAEKGLHGARIRDITELAGANVAAVNYHFRDKFELYLTVLRKAHEGLMKALNEPLTADTAEGRVRQFLQAVMRADLNPDRPRWHTLLLARELVQPTPALDQIQEDFNGPANHLRDAVWEMLPHISEAEASLTTCTIVAEMIFYAHHRHLIQRMFPGLAEPPIEALIKHVVEFAIAALHGLQRSERQS